MFVWTYSLVIFLLRVRNSILCFHFSVDVAFFCLIGQVVLKYVLGVCFTLCFSEFLVCVCMLLTKNGTMRVCVSVIMCMFVWSFRVNVSLARLVVFLHI